MNKIYYLIIVFTLIIGCKAEDNYYYLSAEAKRYMSYNEGETFDLKNSSTGEVVSLKVLSIKTEMTQGHNSGSGHISFGPSGDDFYEL